MDLARAGMYVAAGVAAVALSAGAASAASQADPARPRAAIGDSAEKISDHRGPFARAELWSAAAQYIGITVEQLRSELAADKSLAEIAVAHGRTREGLIDALAQALRTEVGAFVDRKGVPDRKADMRVGAGHGVAAIDVISTAAEYLGITKDELAAKLAAGETLAAVANATSGKGRDGLVQALVAKASERIDQAVREGKITAPHGDEMKERLTTALGRLVDRTRPDRGAPPRGPRTS